MSGSGPVETAIGAAELLKQQRSPSSLRESVTSKGGTTAAALNVFADYSQLDTLLEKAVVAEKTRSQEL